MPKAFHPREITGIAPEAVELLEALGHDDVSDFASLEPANLHEELVKANATLHLTDEEISLADVTRWLRQAATLTAQQGDGEPHPNAVDYEQSSEVQGMLDGSPFALPLTVQMLKEERVAVSQIPLGLLLNRYIGDLDARVNQTTPKSRNHSRLGAASLGVASIQPAGLEGPIMDMDRVGDSRDKGRSGKVATVMQEPSLVNTPLPSTNKGKNPNSRWYIRGVLHPEPKSLFLGALSTFLIFWLVPASVISAVLLILSSEMADRFYWVSPHLLWVQGGLLLVGLIYLFYGLTGKCRICNQKLFLYRSHIKNSKAHHLYGFGYVLPLCLHMMVFRWFRCTHCGTPIRLKK